MTIKVVTSFSPDGYKLYGKRMMETFIKHWPDDIELHVYYEGKKPAFNHKRIKYHNLMKVPGCYQTLQAMSVFPAMAGRLNPNDLSQRDYRRDAFTFCRKVFAQCDAATEFDGVLVWLDADTEFYGDVTVDWVMELFGGVDFDDNFAFLVYQGRRYWHSCASFVAWDTTHPQNQLFWANYYNLITTGRFLALPEWHDSYWLDVLREGMELEASNVTPLEAYMREGPTNVFDVVFAGKGRHLKGNMKFGPKRYQQLIDIVREKQPKTVIEIGTWNGDRAIQMAQASPEMDYIGFDLFEEATPETDEHEKNVKPHHEAKAVLEKLTQAGVRAELHPGNTNDTLPAFIQAEAGRKADVIYIDGGHSVETIQNDFDNALRCISEGGVIVFDDWYEGLPEDELDKVGCNRVLERSGVEYEVLPIADPVKGGGYTKMAVVRPKEVIDMACGKKHKGKGGGKRK